MDLFCRLSNLTKIRHGGRLINDKIMECLANCCPKIVEIDARDSYVTNKGIKYLCKRKNGKLPCPELKNIFIEPASSVTDRGAKYLISHLPSLEIFDYKNVPMVLHSIHERNLRKYKEIQTYNLTELFFFRFSVF